MDKKETEVLLQELKVLRSKIDVSTGKEASGVIEEMAADFALCSIDQAIKALEEFYNG